MNKQKFWRGVLPAITTPFNAGGTIDHGFLAEHARTMIKAGCGGIVPLGSLGEGNALSFDEKLAVLRTLVQALPEHPVIPGIGAMSTAEAVQLAREAERIGCRALMVLPPYVYVGDAAEMEAHASAVIGATQLPCMLYNNPVAYRTDFLPGQVAALAQRHANLEAVKESSTDVRRITAIRALIGDRLEILVGVDDVIVEGIAAGAVGWIAGLVNAYPEASVRLFELARDGRHAEAAKLYRWFLPLLRLDTVPKFVQLIKLVQQQVGLGSERVRAPRALLAGDERNAALAVIEAAKRDQPEV